MTDDDKLFLRKMLADLSVFPVVPIAPAEMARCFRLIIIETLDLANSIDRQKGGTKPKRSDTELEDGE